LTHTHPRSLHDALPICPAAIVRAQADEAVRSGINATPTVRLDDGLTGKSLLLHGPIEGDALLSALDLVASEETVGPKASESPKRSEEHTSELQSRENLV